MKSPDINSYCVFCASGRESRVVSWLLKAGYAPIAPQVVYWKNCAGQTRRALRPLLPGYVFFEAKAEPDWRDIQSKKDVLRVLQYEDGVRALHGADAEFVAWLKKYNGVLEVSHTVQVGTKLVFVDGPLKDMAGKVVKVNKNRKQVQIALGDASSILHTIWCSMAFVEENIEGIAPQSDL